MVQVGDSLLLPLLAVLLIHLAEFAFDLIQQILQVRLQRFDLTLIVCQATSHDSLRFFDGLGQLHRLVGVHDALVVPGHLNASSSESSAEEGVGALGDYQFRLEQVSRHTHTVHACGECHDRLGVDDIHAVSGRVLVGVEVEVLVGRVGVHVQVSFQSRLERMLYASVEMAAVSPAPRKMPVANRNGSIRSSSAWRCGRRCGDTPACLRDSFHPSTPLRRG